MIRDSFTPSFSSFFIRFLSRAYRSLLSQTRRLALLTPRTPTEPHWFSHQTMGNTSPKAALLLGVGVPVMPCAPRPTTTEAVAGWLKASSALPVQKVLSVLCRRQTVMPNSQGAVQREDVPACGGCHAVSVSAPAFAPNELSTGWGNCKGMQLRLMQAEPAGHSFVFVVETDDVAVEDCAALVQRVFAPTSEVGGWGAQMASTRILLIVLAPSSQPAPTESVVTDIRSRLGLSDHPHLIDCGVCGMDAWDEEEEAEGRGSEVTSLDAWAGREEWEPLRVAWAEFFKK